MFWYVCGVTDHIKPNLRFSISWFRVMGYGHEIGLEVPDFAPLPFAKAGSELLTWT
jgi:hypothetical protein